MFFIFLFSLSLSCVVIIYKPFPNFFENLKFKTDTWYCGKIEGWKKSKKGSAKETRINASIGIHSVRMEVNDEMEDVMLDMEKFVWTSHTRSQRRNNRGKCVYQNI